MASIGDWEFTCDRQATLDSYVRAAHGNSERCSCNGCRNFVVAREQAFPQEFVKFLHSLGIDSRKDGEVYHNARLANGLHDYGGWFHFVGELNKTGDFPVVVFVPGFTVWLCKSNAPPLEVLLGLPLVEVQFHVETVPWMLQDPPAQ